MVIHSAYHRRRYLVLLRRRRMGFSGRLVHCRHSGICLWPYRWYRAIFQQLRPKVSNGPTYRMVHRRLCLTNTISIELQGTISYTSIGGPC